MEIKDFLWLMWRAAKYLVLGLVLGIALAVAASIVQRPVYEASTQVLVNRPRQQTSADLLPLSEDQLVSTNALMVKTKPVLDDASYELGYKVKPENVTVTVLPNTMVVRIKVQDLDRDRAAAIANTLVKILIKKNEQILAERYSATESALKAQIDAVQKQIDSLQTQYTQMNDASVQEQLKLVGQQTEQLTSNIAALEQDINNFPAVLTVADRAALAQKQAQLEQQRSLLNLYQQIQVNLTFTGQPGLGGATRELASLTNIQSNINLYQQIYLALQNSLEANRSDRRLNTPDILQIDPAVAPKVPVRPMPTLYLLLGALVGFSLAAGAVLLLDHMKNPIKSIAQAEQLLGLPVLGTVPEPHAAHGVASLAYPSSAEAEAFRALAAAVETTGGKDWFGSLMVANTAASDARTATAANLAVSYAEQGKSVTLVDADLAHPHLEHLFPRGDQSAGGIEGLAIFSSGQVSGGSVKWMSAEKWGTALSAVRKPRSMLIVDGPSSETADAQTLAPNVDAVLLVIRAGHTPAESAQAAVKRFNLAGARVLGVIMTGEGSSAAFMRLSSKKDMPKRKEARSAGAAKMGEAQTPPS
jgi:tyrosine-protein kinase Etk/Wzc